jgi:hypothetical protein
MRWDHVVAWVSGQWMPIAEAGLDHGQVAVFVWRAERAGSDTKMRSRCRMVPDVPETKMVLLSTSSPIARDISITALAIYLRNSGENFWVCFDIFPRPFGRR